MNSRLRALALYGLATLPLGIAVHLFAEAVALGHDGLTAAFVVRHFYLLIVGFFGFLGGKPLLKPYLSGTRLKGRTLRRDLPFRGRGWQFFLLALLLQMGFIGCTLAVEQAPVSKADWLLGSIVALALASLGSAMLASLPNEMLRWFSGWHIQRKPHRIIDRSDPEARFHDMQQLLKTGYVTTLGNRPPPNSFLSLSFV
jgi:hypothetical protein